jgi:WhiB family redox-sensing transcriptional regulator
MTERQRRALLKNHPEVVSWYEFFAAWQKRRNTGQTGMITCVGGD